MHHQESELLFVPLASRWYYKTLNPEWGDRVTASSAEVFETLSIDCICGGVLVCPYCGQPRSDVELRRRNSRYANMQLNFSWCCEECHRRDNECLADMWVDYWSSVM